MISWLCNLDGSCQWIDAHDLYAICALALALAVIGIGSFADWIRHAEKKHPRDKDDFLPPF